MRVSVGLFGAHRVSEEVAKGIAEYINKTVIILSMLVIKFTACSDICRLRSARIGVRVLRLSTRALATIACGVITFVF